MFEKLMGRRGEGYVVIQFVLLALIAVGPWLVSGGWLPNLAVKVGRPLGWVIIVTGVILAMSGVLSLGKNITAVPRPKEDASFVEQGAYRLVRHPIYSGILLGSLGWALATNSLFVAASTGALLLWFDIKSRREERWLVEKYPAYAEYQKRVSKLVPLIY